MGALLIVFLRYSTNACSCQKRASYNIALLSGNTIITLFNVINTDEIKYVYSMFPTEQKPCNGQHLIDETVRVQTVA